MNCLLVFLLVGKKKNGQISCRSGILNFCAVGLALVHFGYKPIGVRIDSGDLAYLSNKVHSVLVRVAELCQVDLFANLEIAASNDINEETILSLSDQGHSISSYGIGTHLVSSSLLPTDNLSPE